MKALFTGFASYFTSSTNEQTFAGLQNIDEAAANNASALRRRKERPGKDTTAYLVGQELFGRISGVMDYGVFVRLPNGESGLVFHQEVCWPGEDLQYRIGEEVKVRVQAFKPGRGLALSIRATRSAELFTQFIEEHPCGTTMPAAIKTVMDYGLFLSLAPGVFGLLHVSAIPNIQLYGRASIGQNLDVRIVDIEATARRIALELK